MLRKFGLILTPQNLIMDTITLYDKQFRKSLTDEEILKRVDEIAARINEDCKIKDPLFLSVLNGSFMFTSDLMKKIDIDCELQFVKMKSYIGEHSTAEVKTLIGPTQEVRGRTVIVIEDIVDTGDTIKELVNQLHPFQPNEIKICTLLYKPGKYTGDIKLNYVGFEIPDDFVVGYGLDYNGLGRNFKDIYTLIK